MVISTIKHLFLGLATLMFTIAVGYYYFYEREAPKAIDEYYVKNVQKRLLESISIAESELQTIQLTIPTDNGSLLRNELPKTTYPYFIFKNGKIEHWSDNKFVPTYSQLTINKKVSLLRAEEKVFVVIKNTISGSEYSCFTLLPIFTDDAARLNGYNPIIFSLQPVALSDSPSSDSYKNVLSPSGVFLFSIELPNTQNALQPLLPQNTLKLLGIGILFLGIFMLLQVKIFVKKHQFGRAFLLFSLYLLATRWLLLVNNLPLINFHSELFDPLRFSESRWAVSLGDRLINALLFVLIFGFLAVYFYRSSIFYRISKSPKIVRSFLAVCCIVLVIIISYLLQSELQNILIVSGNKLDYALSTTLDSSKIAILGYYLSLSIIFFLFSHCCLHLFTRLLPSKTNGVLHWLYGLILSIIVISVIDEQRWIYLLVGLYFLLIYLYSLSRNFYVFRFRTSLYFFLSAFVFAILSTSVLNSYLNQKSRTEKLHFANAFLASRDASAEAIIQNVLDNAEQDESIKNDIQQNILARERVVQRIRENYLNNFANGYQSEIYVFDSSGNNLDILPNSEPLGSLISKIETNSNTKSQRSGIYISRSNLERGTPYYFGIREITDKSRQVGTVVIRLQKNENLATSSNYLSVSNEILKLNPETENFSFALYDVSNERIYSNGAFNYEGKWSKSNNSLQELTSSGIVMDGFQHIGVRGQDNKLLLVSSPIRSWLADWANLSFLFLISVLAISFVLVLYSFMFSYKRKTRMNFTTRIQLYLNTAFVLPLLLVLLIAISIVGTTLRKNQENGFLKNTNSIASSIELITAEWKSGKMTDQFYEQEIKKLSQSSKIDFTLYDNKGIQVYSTAAVNASFFSDYLSPSAYDQLIINKENQFIITEQTKNLNYYATYANIRNRNDNESLIVRVPYLDSQLMLSKQLTDVVSSILMIFIVLFSILLLASYFVSQQLTNPLRAITSHIRTTNLDKLNEPFPMVESGDEMGVLVRAYNKMLKKLEENKIALSTSEKQTAWREMAKQVAHEIKNPLTPMKLSIQQLQRTLPADSPKTKIRIERALNSLNEQIDNISEIANSFSEFAKMPVPRSEDFDLVKVIQNTIDLYSNNKNMDIRFKHNESQLIVRGDRQLMSRMLTNLIINGLQSVPINKRPEIIISLYRNAENNYAIIEVKDNGVGIPEEIREKVFMPSFSTKVGGSGLGLALSKRGIEHAGGNIWFETVIDEGTSFFVDLPLVI